ncbi:hypothetical protein [Halarcobacter bivalviorum]|uniref:hypothetical protein n=1 Tax=Halarcobacter bivalviorum TaxID=663364 RepID=UPI00100A3582|nr:hypothetical protein [Halarcobacter bivalviorum]RXK05368.1 hypothetical protein CRU97_08475 [Halarcobacter bivalviorum]
MKLKEKQETSLSISQGNNSRAAGRDYLENPIFNNSYTTYKPLEINENLEIKIKEQKSSYQDKKALKLSFVIVSIIFAFFISSNFTDLFYNGIISFLIVTIFFYFLFHLFLFIPFLLSAKGILQFQEENMIFNFRNRKIKSINFEDIRSLRKEKNSFGYSFYLYTKKELYPVVSFYVESIDVSLAIEELITYNINESIKD